MTCSVFIRKKKFQQIGKSLPFLLSKIFLGNCNYIHPKTINPVTKEHAIARSSSQKRYTFITGGVRFPHWPLNVFFFFGDSQIDRYNKTRRCFKIFYFILFDKKNLFFVLFQTINKAVTKLQASANSKACSSFCKLYWYKQPFTCDLQHRCS